MLPTLSKLPSRSASSLKRYGEIFGLFLLLATFSQTAVLAQTEMPTQRYLDQFQVTRAWWGTSSIDGTRDRVKFLTLGKKHLYVQSELGTVTAFDPATGERKWVSQVGSEKGAHTRIVETDELLMISSGMILYALQPNDGNIRWQASLGFATSASPAGAGHMLYFPTNSGTLYAIDVKRLNDMHVSGKLAKEAPLAVKWKFITSNPINISPVATDLYVSFVGADGIVYSVAAANHELRFRFAAGAPLAAPLVMTKETFIVTAQNFHIYNIHQSTGQIRWEFVSGPQISKSPQVVGEHLYLAPDHGSLFCVSMKDGSKIWESDGASGFIAANDRHVYAYDRLDNVVILSKETGEVEYRLGLMQFNQRVANDQTDRVYLSTPDGLIIALHDQDLPEAQIHSEVDSDAAEKPAEQPEETAPAENTNP